MTTEGRGGERGAAEGAKERGEKRGARRQRRERAQRANDGGAERRAERRTTWSEHGDRANTPCGAWGLSGGAERSDRPAPSPHRHI